MLGDEIQRLTYNLATSVTYAVKLKVCVQVSREVWCIGAV